MSDIVKTALPVVPDDRAPNCNGCGTSFGFICTRQHCKSCGKAFCYCCSKKAKIPDLDNNKEVRVCFGCFEELVQTIPTPEAEVTSCTKCGSNFGFFCRKKQCQSCEKDFCMCCSKKTQLPGQYNKDARVCMGCLEKPPHKDPAKGTGVRCCGVRSKHK